MSSLQVPHSPWYSQMPVLFQYRTACDDRDGLLDEDEEVYCVFFLEREARRRSVHLLRHWGGPVLNTPPCFSGVISRADISRVGSFEFARRTWRDLAGLLAAVGCVDLTRQVRKASLMVSYPIRLLSRKASEDEVTGSGAGSAWRPNRNPRCRTGRTEAHEVAASKRRKL
ncbi:hypothetical protein BT63DRAFT_456679 [Microthyrium microscopicum]|uniref:Uncharacterized protein n=1 Tax=Microthyrium microscopicum TaxID=703497 RepID=A0A6A6U8F0_9PEZI|nr:hypothetical protein BT63DRAFT_456679 [Microthyrium microscopicum]